MDITLKPKQIIYYLCVTDLQLTDNGQMLLNISPDHVKNIISYKRLFQQFNQSDTIFK